MSLGAGGNAKFYFALVYKQNIYLLEPKNYTPMQIFTLVQTFAKDLGHFQCQSAYDVSLY